jgi:hypothetical protein
MIHHGCVHKEIASTLEQAQLQQQKVVGQGVYEGSILGVVKGVTMGQNHHHHPPP